MQITFRLGDFILCSLIALRRVLECVEHIFESSLGPRMDVLASGFQLPIGNHTALLCALLESQSPDETRQKSNAFIFFSIAPVPSAAGYTSRSRAFLVPLAWPSIYGRRN